MIRNHPARAHAPALVVCPTYNERDNLPFFIAAVRRAAPEADILVVDDNSPDGTGQVADGLAASDPHISVLHRPNKRGLGTAYVDAFRRGLRQNYARFIEMDGDLSHDPRYLPAFFDAFDAGADIVIGSRNVAGGGVEGWGPGRHFLSKGGSLYSRAILGLAIRDLTSGFKGFSRKALESVDLDRVQSNGYSFQIEMTYRAVRKGMKVAEVPIVFVDRRAGKSKMNRRIVAEAVGMVWKLRWQAARGEF